MAVNSRRRSHSWRRGASALLAWAFALATVAGPALADHDGTTAEGTIVTNSPTARVEHCARAAQGLWGAREYCFQIPTGTTGLTVTFPGQPLLAQGPVTVGATGSWMKHCVGGTPWLMTFLDPAGIAVNPGTRTVVVRPLVENQPVRVTWRHDPNATAVTCPSTLSVKDASVVEGNVGSTQAVFAVNLSRPIDQTVTVNFATANGTATAGSDYTSTSGTLTFAPGETSKQIAVDVLGDTVDEPDETFFANLSGASNAVIGDGQAVGTIGNDEQRLSVGDVTLVEGNFGSREAVLKVTLQPASIRTVSVRFATANGTAMAGSDYAATSGTLTFAPGETEKQVVVKVNGDITDEPDETLFVNLSASSNAAIADGQGRGTIVNDDGPPHAPSGCDRSFGAAELQPWSCTFEHGSGTHEGYISATNDGFESQNPDSYIYVALWGPDGLGVGSPLLECYAKASSCSANGTVVSPAATYTCYVQAWPTRSARGGVSCALI